MSLWRGTFVFRLKLAHSDYDALMLNISYLVSNNYWTVFYFVSIYIGDTVKIFASYKT